STLSLHDALPISPPRYPWRRILLSCVVSGVALAVFALSHQLVVTAAALFVLGMSQANNRTLTQALQLAETEDALRGRVSSLWVVNRGTMPIGSVLLAGTMAWWGGSLGLAAMGALCLVVTAGIGIWTRRLWSLTP